MVQALHPCSNDVRCNPIRNVVDSCIAYTTLFNVSFIHYIAMNEGERSFRGISVDQGHVLPGQNLLQLGIRLGCLTVISRVPCAWFVCHVARQEGGYSSIIDPF